MLKSIDEFLGLALEGKKINCGIRLAPDMHELILKKAKEEHLDLSEYVRAVLAVHLMPEIIEKEFKKEVNQEIIRDGEDALKLHFADKLGRFKLLRKLTEMAEEKTEDLYKTFIKLEDDCLNEIKDETIKELG